MLPADGLPASLREMIARFQDVARFDHSVSVPELGSLFHFETDKALGQMQQGVAEICQASFAYLTTNGTTSLNVMALLAITRPGDTVLCQRDSHVSVFAPMIHAGLRPVYVEPVYETRLGLPLGITPGRLQRALKENPDVRAVFLTYPNYFGIAADIYACADVVARRQLPLIIDSAHGTHFCFHPDLPLPAQATSAAIVTQSIHKTCAALSQGSLALFNGEAPVSRFYEVVNSLGFVSTSFSYVILASVVMAVLQLYEQGQPLLERAMQTAEETRQAINRIDGLFSFGREALQPGFCGFDPLRITVDVSGLGLTGFAVEEQLIRQFRIYPEMATLRHVLFLLTMADDAERGRQIVTALQQLAGQKSRAELPPALPIPATPPQAVPPRPAFYHPHKRRVPVYDSIGAVSAETIACYPPGSAIVVAGEQLTQEVIAFLDETRQRGGTLKGASDASFETIQVLA